ncbi:AAA domain-containing protein [Succinivibrio dextrinosolvens DSM 3072]|uniref:AAA domain-containing protein n=1 Tax=Succinivibrio dextrinosolvens DSM 3072 TaxID=1123324 RepID=A0A1T4VHD9_9GAMM|nr:AAA family ATPase [Succinivibrio dextrinosolvens]SKA64355.1 AAA domain-containing protein [Succinivibrio dextrinosolvens DSM 3072]
MSNIKINWIYLQNFKGFIHLNLQFDCSHSVILGGPNGYGKTTVFDALEILFTGKIRRMDSYVSLHNNSTRMDQDEQKPLVYSSKSNLAVIVRAGIQSGDREIILERHADVYEMRNPVDFTPFNRLYLSENGPDAIHEISPDTLRKFGIEDLAKNYDFLYYLSQEETVSFLKMKESERSRLVQQLFDTSRYEDSIQRLGDAITQCSKLSSEHIQKKNSVDEEIKKLTSSVVGVQNTHSQYISLSPDKSLLWDCETPNFSHEDFNLWLSDDGV